LDYSSNDVAIVDITFSYQYHTVYKKSIGNVETELRKAGISMIGGI
jgi:adenine/guanine phosphoribosyltransferase-like PRPP-binding protein